MKRAVTALSLVRTPAGLRMGWTSALLLATAPLTATAAFSVFDRLHITNLGILFALVCWLESDRKRNRAVSSAVKMFSND